MRSIIATTVAVAALAVPAASAQEAPVTGSHIAGAPSLSQVRVIDRAQIEASGYATFGELLARLPEQGAAQGPNVDNGADGSIQLALHDLGARRTLVLVDGKRWVPYTTTGEVDLQTIPTEAIERIEILESGGSAIYGPDAVGGVVNVITRKRVNATEASAGGGLSTRGDAGRYDLGLTSGFSSDKLDVFGGVGFVDRRPLSSGARGFASQPLAYDFASGAVSRGGSPIVPSGTVLLNPAQCGTATCRDLAQRFGSTSQIFVSLGNGSFRPLLQSDLYNYQSANFLTAPAEDLSLFTNAELRFSPIARAYFQGSFVNRRSSNLLAPDPVTGAVLDAGSAFNPFGLDVRFNRRIAEAPGRSEAWDLNTYRFVGGVNGGLPSGLGFDLSFTFGRTSGSDDTHGSFVTTYGGSFGPTFSDGAGLHCGTPSQSIFGCVPANPFGPPGSLTPATLTAMGLHQGMNDTAAQMISARLDLTQALFALGPAREATLAAGYEYRRQAASFTAAGVGGQLLQDDTYNFASFDGEYGSHEGYLELDLPVLDQVDLRAAVRGIDDSDFGAAATWLAGGRWQIARGLVVRGSYSTGVRAPAIADRFFDQGALASALPVGPERSRNATAGIAYEPSLIKGLVVSLDYWNVAVTRAIVIPGCAGEFPTCQVLGPTTNAGGVITSGLELAARESLASPWGRFGLRGAFSYLLRYDLTFPEGQTISAAGNYDLGSGSVIGGLTPRVKADAALDWRLSDLAVALGGRLIGGFDECADVNGQNLLQGRCSLGASPLPRHAVPAWVSIDLGATYTIAGTTLSAGIQNLFDATPPQVFDSFLTFADPGYDFIGRSVYARASQRF